MAVFVAALIFCPNAFAWQMKQAPLMTDWAAQVDSANPLPEYPRPQMVRTDWLNLNGVWQFKRGYAADAVPVGQALGGDILVPFPAESAISGVMAHYDRLWYRRTFTVPSEWTGKKIIINFGAVDWEAQVYVNGTSVGTHQGGFDPFSYDITDYLTSSGPQEIIVRVYDPTNAGGQPRGKQNNAPGGIVYTACTGIWQTVWLEPVAPTSIGNVKIVPDVDGSSLKITVNTSGSAAGMTVTATAKDTGAAVGSVTGDANTELSISIPNPKLWSPDSPFLYDLDISLKSGETTVDAVTSYFGMRKISVGTDGGIKKMFLNNQFVFQMGPLDQGYWPDGIYTAPTDTALKFDLDMAKSFGYNMVRKHAKVEPQRWYYWADKLGLLVWQDMPYGNNTTTADQTQFEYELQKMIETHWNSPSIIMWTLWNEAWGMYGLTETPQPTTRVTNWAKGFDPSRIVSLCSGFTSSAGDVLDFHGYPDPYYPDSPATMVRVCGEYGGIGYPITGHMWTKYTFSYTDVSTPGDLTDLYAKYTSTEVGAFKANKGLSAAVYTQITDVEGEINGLLTYDRKVIKPLVAGIVGANHFSYVPQTVTVSASAGTGGTISPSGAVALHMATNNTFTIAPAPVGYAIANVVVDDVSQGAISTYTFNSVTTTHTITASFSAVPTCTITASAETGGTISESGDVLVNQGGNKTFTIAPSSGYTISNVLVDGVSRGAITSYTFSNITTNHIVSAQFAAMPDQVITATAGANGSISPGGNVAVGYNASKTFTFSGNLGYKLGEVTVDGVSQGAIASYTFVNVTTNHSISATFVPLSPVACYQFESDVTDTQGAFNGTAYNAPTYVTGQVGTKAIQFNGTNQYVTIARPVSDDWTISFFVKTSQASPTGTQWYSGKGLVDGEVSGAANDFGITYLNSKIAFGVGNADTTVQSTSTINSGNWVHVACTRNGVSGEMKVYINGTLEGTATGPAGTRSAPATLHIGNQQTNSNYFNGAIDHLKFFNSVMLDSDVATLAKEGTIYTIAASAGTGGSISPAGNAPVSFAASQTFNVTPATGYSVSDVLVDGASMGPVTSYTFDYVNASHTIAATFSVGSTYIITATAGIGGTISESGNVLVNQGGNKTFTIAPSSGYTISDVLVDGVSQGAIASYTFSNVVANRSISVTFAVIPNTVPTITDVADQSTNEDTATSAIPIMIGDGQTAAASLTVSGSSSNTTLVPNANIAFGGSGPNRTVTITPAANQIGTASITLTVSDGSLTATDTFVLTVNAVNDAPTISDVANQSIPKNTSTSALPFTVGDVDNAPGSLTVTASSSNSAVVLNSGIVLGGSGANRTVTITPVTGMTGISTITLTVSDGTLSASDTFDLTVTSTLIPATYTWNQAGSPTVYSWVTPANWTANSGYPNGTNHTAVLNTAANDLFVTLDAPITLGGIGAVTGTLNIASGTSGGPLTFDNGNGILDTIDFSAPLRYRLQLGANLVLNDNLNLTYSSGSNSNNSYIQGVVSGAGGLTLNYSSTATFALGAAGGAANTHQGGTSLAGVAALRNISAAKANVVGTGALSLDQINLQIATFAQTFAGLNGGGNSAVLIASGTPAVTLNGSDSYAYSGVIAGGISLAKSGTGTQVLSGANTYTGSTSVTGGSLLVNGSLATGSAVTVGASGTLGGTGVINGAITNGGTIAPGSGGIGALTAGAVTLSAGSKAQIELSNWTGTTAGTHWDTLNCASLALSGTTGSKITLKLVPSSLGNFSEASKTFTIATSGSAITGFAANAIAIDSTSMPGAGTWAAQLDATGKLLQVVYTASAGYTSWQGERFTPEQISAGLAAADADPDHDGYSNLAEFAFNGDPMNASSKALVVTEQKDTGADGKKELVFTCAVRRGAVFSANGNNAQVSAAIDGVVYTVEGAANLAGSWNAAITSVGASNTPPSGSGLPVLTSGWEYRSFSAFNGLTERGFLRAKVTNAP